MHMAGEYCLAGEGETMVNGRCVWQLSEEPHVINYYHIWTLFLK